MKVATWNVNGIRARASQVREWLERERPDVVCLQELEAESSQVPEERHVPEYHAYWHGRKGYSGVSRPVRGAPFGVVAVSRRPPFGLRRRIVDGEGRRGVISVPATSAGASATCWRHRPSRLAPRAAWCGTTSARVITRRW